MTAVTQTEKLGVYSPGQVAAASFAGGPFATVYVLWRNFRTLGNQRAATQTLIWGVLFVAVLLLTVPILPDKFPNYLIPVIYMLGARTIAEKYQMTKQAILGSTQYGFQSNWNVAGISAGFIIAFLVVTVAWLMLLDQFGLFSLD